MVHDIKQPSLEFPNRYYSVNHLSQCDVSDGVGRPGYTSMKIHSIGFRTLHRSLETRNYINKFLFQKFVWAVQRSGEANRVGPQHAVTQKEESGTSQWGYHAAFLLEDLWFGTKYPQVWVDPCHRIGPRKRDPTQSSPALSLSPFVGRPVASANINGIASRWGMLPLHIKAISSPINESGHLVPYTV